MPQKQRKSDPMIAILSLIFFLSGLSALIYQVVWQRFLTLYYGVGSVSIVLIVGIYMFGLGVGALIGGRIADRFPRLIILYCLIEFLIGLFGAVSLPLLDVIGRKTAGCDYTVAVFYIFLFLSLPTLLMGTTLPILTKIFNHRVKNFLETVSFLYFINTLGAALGTIFATYILISLWGLDKAVYCAAAVNFVLAALIFYVNTLRAREGERDSAGPQEPLTGSPLSPMLAYVLVFVTGFLAIGYEVLWFRVIEILVKASPYAFSSVLSVYLLGIAAGSLWIRRFMARKRLEDPRSLFFFFQLMIGVSVAVIFIAYYHLTKKTSFGALTFLSFNHELHPNPFLFLLPPAPFPAQLLRIFLVFDVFIWPLFFVFVPTFFMGASFPLVSYLTLANRREEGKTIGTIYFFTVLGNIMGSLVTGFLLLTYCGTEITVLAFSTVGILLGMFVVRLGRWKVNMAAKVIFLSALLALNVMWAPGKGALYRMIHWPSSPIQVVDVYFEEGLEGTDFIYTSPGGGMTNFINGLAHGGRPGHHFFHKTLEAVSFAPRAEHVCVIGLGTASTVEALIKLDEVKSVTVLEINKTLVKNLEKIPEIRAIMSDPRVRLVVDDGRRFLLRDKTKYDLILMDPLRATTAYSNNLYSRQFFRLAQDRLTEGGILMIWIDEHTVTPMTAMSVFSHYRLYKSFVLFSDQVMVLNDRRFLKFLGQFTPEEREAIRATVYQGRAHNDGRFIGAGQGILRTKGPLINQDWRPIAEYYLGHYWKRIWTSGPIKLTPQE
ncbi:MAG: fused MFS/spermidine synthase [Candidatus Omnitrophota bacterium]|nr:fused MFS/spermidine synthase [Candidatus Omnitrophota bacterium]MDZ4243463.1 fused MFS/spermidine synthase [Candidatus Omnitrophota bacterium]